MWRNGFGKFCLVGLGMLLLVGLAFNLLKAVYRFIFGTTIPTLFIFLMIGLALLVCLASFLYRYAWEGYEVGERPMLYPQWSAKIETYAFFCFISALVLIWSCESQWWGWAWVGIYFAGEILIASVAEKRVFAIRLKEAKIWFPEMTPAEQVERAKIWLESGLTALEYECGPGL